MKSPGDVVLVACYELGHQPLTVAWAAAFLERAGFAPAIVDVSVEALDVERLRRARLVAISVPMHTALRLGVAVADRVRQVNRDCYVCFFGLYATLNAEYLLAHGADAVLAGEVEDALVELARRLERGERPQPARRPELVKLDFPVPSRAGLPALDKYARLERDGEARLAGHVEASRGCKHACRHCPIPPVYGGRFFVVPAEVVAADVRRLVAAGATHITFGDPDFFNGPRHALGVARRVHAEFPALTFDFTAKVEHLLRHAALLPELAELGCVFVVTAAESLSDEVLRHLGKGHTREDIVRAIDVLHRAGIAARPTWVPFTPWTTLDDYRGLLDFVETAGLIDHIDPVQYSIRLLVPPGSLLASADAMRPYLGPLVPEAFSYQWTHPDPRMDRLQANVAALVEEAARRGEDGALTFGRIRALADAAAGAPPRTTASPPAARRRPPRLTEPWFC
jgi:radical SAM superfamily enzyme YgiQ (UPF0313 family)